MRPPRPGFLRGTLTRAQTLAVQPVLRLSPLPKIYVGFSVAVAVLFLLGLVAERSTAALETDAHAVARTHEVMRLLEEVVSDVAFTEAGQRAWLLTGDASQLVPFQAARVLIERKLDALADLLADDPQQLSRLGVLRQRIHQHLDGLEAGVSARQASGLPAVAPETIAPRPRAPLEDIHTRARHMTATELTWLQLRAARARASAEATQIAIPVGVGLALLIVAIAVLLIRRDLLQRERAERLLRDSQAGLQAAREAADAANEAKSQFLAQMSHELRTPLNSVIGFTNVLLKNRSGALGEQELDYLRRILSNGRNLLDLINDVLDLARIEARRVDLEYSDVDLHALVQDVIAQFETQIRAKRIALEAESPPALAPLRSDARRLRQIVVNLVTNAVKFTDTGGVVVAIGAHDHGGPAWLEVRDTGIGIPDDRLESIFEAFRQVDNSTARKYGGSGLGLSICQSLAGLLSYRISVASAAGRGSVFRVDFGAPAPGTPSVQSRDVQLRAAVAVPAGGVPAGDG